MTLAGSGVGLGLGRSLREQTQRLPGATGHLFLDGPKILLRIGLDLLQLFCQLLLPGFGLRIGQLGSGDPSGCRRCRCPLSALFKDAFG